MQPLHLILTARDLVEKHRDTQGGHRVREANLRRAISTAYYAMFHALAQCCADTMVGGSGADRTAATWRRVYRALDHKQAKGACSNISSTFPSEIKDFAASFAQMQSKRHAADYDPDGSFFKSDVINDINAVEDLISRFEGASVKDRRAFAVHVLFKARSD